MHPTTEVNSGAGRRMSNWPAFRVLLIGAGLGALGVISYELSVVPQTVRVPVALIVAAGVIQALVLAAIACAVGLWLGERVGLGAPLLRALLAGDPAAPRTLRALLAGTIGRGLAVGCGLAALGVALPPLLPHAAGAAPGAARPGAWQGLLATLYGGIQEEILFRFGVMTLLVWLGIRLLRQERPGAGLIWAANIGAALLFGGGHLPLAFAVYGASLPITIVIVLENALGGIVFGWVYWRRGLLAAMIAHASADIVLHVVVPALRSLMGLH